MTTEGKWSVVEIDNKKNRYAVDDDGYPVATVVGEANANLIASAPEMLKALKKCANFYFESSTDFQDEVYALIARAEGK